MLSVTNKNEFELHDRYDGKDFVFPPNKKVAISEEAARHIFGLGDPDKTNTLVRLGWMFSSKEKDEAMEKLNKFSFDVVNDLSQGEVIEAKEQGSAPLQAEPSPDSASGGAEKGDGEAQEGGKTIVMTRGKHNRDMRVGG